MIALVNRVPTGRAVSLHAELKYLKWKFGENTFTLNGMKLDPSLEKTQLDFFEFSVEDADYGQYNGKYDPYLQNPLDTTGFHLTASTVRDSQKSKLVSECANAMLALGWLVKEGSGFKLSAEGLIVAALSFNDEEFLAKFRSSILNYGPILGVLYSAKKALINGQFKKSDVVIGYPDTRETVTTPDGRRVALSAGSQSDSITRTRSTLFAWAMTAGLIWPADLQIPDSNVHVHAKELLRGKIGNWRNYTLHISEELFNGNHTIKRPLSYGAMTKSTKALRERGQANIRETTLRVEEIIKSRRFAIVYSLAVASQNETTFTFDRLLQLLERDHNHYFVNGTDHTDVLNRDLDIAITSGLVYERTQDHIRPLVKTNTDDMLTTAPEAARGVFRAFASELISD